MWSTSCPIRTDIRNTDYLRSHARHLLRRARGAERSIALPILRRLLAAKVLKVQRLTELHTQRESIQLKQILAMLAVELGYADWATCKQRIDTCDSAVIDRYRLDAGAFGDFEMNWFADVQQAQVWQHQNGGYLVRYGTQAVAILSP